MSANSLPLILLTPGEPAGIGPDLALMLAAQPWPCRLAAVADPLLLAERANQLGATVNIATVTPDQVPPHRAGELAVLPVPLRAPVTPGQLNPANAGYVLDTLTLASDLCRDGTAAALVTAPVQKSVINDAGFAFTGHTEFLQARCGVPRVVMLLTCPGLRVALATTHLPLRAVPDAVTGPLLDEVIAILDTDLRQKFGITRPHILVAGLNPHAGEGGHLGREEIEVISPALARARSQGIDVVGPLPADTLFTPRLLAGADAVLTMYHDQGLPVLKHQGFGEAVNVTLGLPIIRTSVDHGTALDLAGSGRAEAGSLAAALRLALAMTQTGTS